jgi:hypothetical protein
VEHRSAPALEPLQRRRALAATLARERDQLKEDLRVNTVWILVGLGLVGAVVSLFGSWRRNDRPSDLGAVSHQWIAEHRLGRGDSRR